MTSCALLCVAGPVRAQTAAVAAAASAPAKTTTVSQKQVIEDDNVRIEETRLRGQAQRISVKNKLRGRDYEIIVGPAGKDPSHDRGAAGQSAWSLFAF